MQIFPSWIMQESGEVQEAKLVPYKRHWTATYPEDVEHEGLERVLEAIREGKNGFEAACLAEGWPVNRVVAWQLRDTPAGFRERYADARKAESEAMAANLPAVAEGLHRKEGERDTAGAVYRDQLRIKTAQWLLAKRDPGKFGERGAVDQDGKPVVKQVIMIAGAKIEF